MPEKVTPENVKVISNRPEADTILTPVFLYEKVLKKMKKESENVGAGLCHLFPRTFSEFEKLTGIKEEEKCSGCALNRKGKPMVKCFVEELKGCPEDVQIKVVGKLGKKVSLSIGQKWVNLSTNEVVPFEFKDVHINPPKDNGKIESPSIVGINDTRPKYIFINRQGPGDVVMITAAIRDLHINHPGKFITDVITSSQHLWEGNPYVEWGKYTLDPTKTKPLNEKDSDVNVVTLGYPLIHQSNQGPYHFSEAFTEEIEDVLKIRIKRRLGFGDIHIRPEEEVWGRTERTTWFSPYDIDPDIEYWVIDAGHKQDFTAKFWGSNKFQAVVEHFKGKIQFVQIGHIDHIHPVLDGVINLIGKTDDRQLVRLIWASSGVLTPVSLPMVLAAAIPFKPRNNMLERPCVVVAGGREPSGWQAHTNHQFIHTCGSLPCCSRGGCWKSRIKPIGDGDEKDVKNMCENVTVDDFGEEVPYCMHMITPEDVIRRIDMYRQFHEEDRKLYTYNRPEKK